MGKRIFPLEEFCTRVTYTDLGNRIKVIAYSAERAHAFADANGKRYNEIYNDKEPFDFTSHGFLIDKADLSAGGIDITFTPWRVKGVFTDEQDYIISHKDFAESELLSLEGEIKRADRGLELISSEKRQLCDGAEYTIEHMRALSGEPVVCFVFKYNPKKVTMLAGTPNGTLDYRNQKQTVMQEAEYEKSLGKRVLGAFNADFFDMFGDCAPSGLCVKDGCVVANPHSARYFFGVTKDGEPIIDTLAGKPYLLEALNAAVSGRDLLLSDGEICDVAVSEPFGFTAHPRTLAGITYDGNVIVAVVDGRRPWHSNGATLTDAALLLKAHGCVRGLNLDGGGSSTFIVENEAGELQMLNSPADLHRPTEDLIRDVFDSIILIEK